MKLAANKFNLDLFEKLIPLNLDDEAQGKVVDLVFWAMGEVLSDTKSHLVKTLAGEEPMGDEVWDRACSLITQNRAMHGYLNNVIYADTLEEAVSFAAEGITLGEPSLAAEMLLDRDVTIVDKVGRRIIQDLKDNDCSPPAELVVMNACEKVKRSLR